MIALAALAFMAWGCSSDNDDDQGLFKMGNDARPAEWRIPNFNDYELTMSIDVKLQDVLQAYGSENDLLCAFIQDEIRGLAEPIQVNGQWVFPMTVGSNASDVPVFLSYYCDRLHRIYTTQWTTFDTTLPPTGVGGIYQPEFVPKNETINYFNNL